MIPMLEALQLSHMVPDGSVVLPALHTIRLYVMLRHLLGQWA